MGSTHAHGTNSGRGRLPHPHPLARWLNTDGQRHPAENALAFVSLGLAAASLICATQPAWHIPGGWMGLVGALLGGFDQFISKTRGERWIIIVGLIGSALGFALNLANGGLLPAPGL